MVGGAEAKRVQVGDRSRAHREDVAKDSADAGRSPLVGLDVRGMVVALDLEDRRHAAADVDATGVLAGALQHERAFGRELTKVSARALVRTVLGPHHREHAELLERGRAAEMAAHPFVLGAREAVLESELFVDRAPSLWRALHPAFRCARVVTHSTAERNSSWPSAQPSNGSTACSGWGIRPTMLPSRLAIPAMSWSAPFGAPSA